MTLKKIDSLAIASLAIGCVLLILGFALSNWYAPIVTLLAAAALFLFWTKFAAPIAQNVSASANRSSKEPNETSFTPTRSKVTFKQVAGLNSAREELDEIVDYFKNPSKYGRFGVVLPRGVLLAGPPGVGKTLMAKAIAGEAGVAFFYASGSSFAHLYVGVGPKKVAELFAAARKSAPSIVFIDEIDAVGKARGGARSDERENTLNQLLTEMDGFESQSGVVVLAATNRIELLDSALLRPGRFDRRVEIGLPNINDRLEILKIAFSGKPHSIDLNRLAQNSTGFSGAALSTLANEAALHALKRNAEKIEQIDIEAIKEKVISLKKSGEWLEADMREKRARYQAAKAIAAKRLGSRFETVKLANDFLQDHESVLSESELFALLCARLAGFALWRSNAESGASFCESDAALARKIAERYIAIYDPTELKGGAEKLMQEAIMAAGDNLDSAAIEKIAALLLANESAAFEVL
ncbi:MAG: AAA family ATPase [Helicobacteraceae bacterium]|jgi:ATP-dependent metalloprotease FtsH|nr:AAA family ATPase [Helicobacteraceae bacterium]